MDSGFVVMIANIFGREKMLIHSHCVSLNGEYLSFIITKASVSKFKSCLGFDFLLRLKISKHVHSDCNNLHDS